MQANYYDYNVEKFFGTLIICLKIRNDTLLLVGRLFLDIIIISLAKTFKNTYFWLDSILNRKDAET